MASSKEWFETIAEAQRRATRRLPRSVYMALVKGSEQGRTMDDDVNAFGELGFRPRIADTPHHRDQSTKDPARGHLATGDHLADRGASGEPGRGGRSSPRRRDGGDGDRVELVRQQGHRGRRRGQPEGVLPDVLVGSRDRILQRADAISVSNHGSNNLYGTPASIRALPAVADAVVDQVEVLLEGGIRRRSDVVKALALGANALLIGRAYLWGMAANGEAGEPDVLEILRSGISEALLGLGRGSIHDLVPDDLIVPPGFTRLPQK
jgi:hypothetical protein